MRILTVDIGTGTQDIYLYDSRLDIENGFKLILPSPTMIVHRQIRQATRTRTPVLLTGRQMGGGPSAWAAAEHARAGLPVYATEDAARTIDDELEKVAALGIKLVSEKEGRRLPASVLRVGFRDFEFDRIAKAFSGFGVSLAKLDAVAVAVFDHGAAPPGVSDRQFRFDYLDRRIRESNKLSAFAYRATEVPPILSRLQAVAASATALDCPLVVMDTAPAAVLGATFDPQVAKRLRSLIVNVGNFHTLAFRLGEGGTAPGTGIEGVFEHHTGEVDLAKLESLLRALASGTLRHEDVFNDMGHGALVYSQHALDTVNDEFDVVVTGPRRSMFRHTAADSAPHLRPYFAVPFGDMMIAGCFGLLAATADVLPAVREVVELSLNGADGRATAPWDVE